MSRLDAPAESPQLQPVANDSGKMEFTDELRKLYAKLYDPQTGVQRKDRRRGLKTYHNTAIGSEIVDWVKAHTTWDEVTCLEFCGVLWENALIKPSGGSATRFKPNDSLYTLSPFTASLSRPSTSSSTSFTLSRETLTLTEDAPDDEQVKGWLNFKVGTTYKKYWFELEEVTEFLSIYTQNPMLGPLKSRLVKSINLEDAKVQEKDDLKNKKYAIKILCKNGKTYTIAATDSSPAVRKEIRDRWLVAIKKSRDFAMQQRIGKKELDAAPEVCRLCIGDEDEDETEEPLGNASDSLSALRESRPSISENLEAGDRKSVV